MRNKYLAQIGLELERKELVWVCQDCLDDSMLKMLCPSSYDAHQCQACGQLKVNVLTPSRLAAFIGEYLPKHFEVGGGLYPGYEQTLTQVVKGSIGCRSDAVCEAIARCLERQNAGDEHFYSPGQTYSRAASPFDDQEHERWFVIGEWHNIANELAHGRRFFNSRAQQFFKSLVGEALESRRLEGPDESAVMTTLPAGSSFYRARAASSPLEAEEFSKEPYKKLGAPPKERAANNRMSASGVPFLYLANDIETCIAEIRPSIGDLVVVANFQSTAQLTFFDFNALSHQLNHKTLSLFTDDYERREQHRRLLNYLHDEIARPVRSGEVDYVMTQALAEFIRFNLPSRFDGISFRSVQNRGGINYVLFDKSSHAELVTSYGHARFDVTVASADIETHEIAGVKYRLKGQDGAS